MDVRRLSWSLGEIEALARKAAHGAGKPWGLAEEAGWAVRWLAQSGLPGPEALAASLQNSSGKCPIVFACELSDPGDLETSANFGLIEQPLLVLPFLGRCCPHGRAVVATIGPARAEVSAHKTIVSGVVPAVGQIEVQGMCTASEPILNVTRVAEITPGAMSVLERFAARTYAPATEASRELGAGAGLTDND